jgi:hypothetical protein
MGARTTKRGVGVVLVVAAFAAGCTGTNGGYKHFTSGKGSSGGSGGGNNGNGGDDNGGGPSFDDGGGGGGDASAAGDGAVGPVDVTPPCDTGLAIDGDAASFAKAIGICKTASQAGWGLVSASYSKAFGSQAAPASAQWGLLPKFGSVVKPREGALLGALSNGYGREYDDVTSGNTDFVAGQARDGMNYPTGGAPPGFPKAAQGCPQDNLVNDMIDLKLVLKAPMDASGFSFDFDFFSSEWPNYVCSNFNDAFIAYLESSGTTDNISFDSQNNPVAVNLSFMDRCTPNAPIGCLRSNGPMPDPPLATSTCGAGVGELGGTGYGDTDVTQCDMSVSNVTATLGASTGWLTTTAPIQPGEQFTLEFMIWDAGDGLLDSSVLVDNFKWLGGSVPPPQTQRPPQ